MRPDIVYPLYLKKLGVKHPSETTQYWLEVARRCFTTDLRARVDGRLRLRILGDDDWRLSNFPPGDGAERGAQAFRRHYGAAGGRLKGA